MIQTLLETFVKNIALLCKIVMLKSWNFQQNVWMVFIVNQFENCILTDEWAKVVQA